MADVIPNSEYITVNNGGIFVGETPATHYRGVEIGGVKRINENFKTIQSQYPNICDMRFLTSKTTGNYNEPGVPVAENGDNLWASVRFFDGYVGPWVLVTREYTYDFVIKRRIAGELTLMAETYVFLAPLLGRYKDVIIRINLQNMAGKYFELNGYKITIEKIAKPQNER